MDDEKIRNALSFLSSECRDDWVKFGMAVKSELGDSGFDVWDQWSQGSDTYQPKTARAVWSSFKAAGQVTVATLYKAALDAGWRDDGQRPTQEQIDQRNEKNRQRAIIQGAETARVQETVSKNAGAIWSRAESAEGNLYLERKQILSYGTRSHKGMLAVPVRDSDKLWSIQFIRDDGQKVFMKNGKMAGCYFGIGKTAGAEIMCVVEGFATGATIHAATGHPVAVAFNAGNLLAVARKMAATGLKLVICADDDHKTSGNPGIYKAVEAAVEVGAKLAIPAFHGDRQDSDTDFNDMQIAHGLAAVNREFYDCISG